MKPGSRNDRNLFVDSSWCDPATSDRRAGYSRTVLRTTSRGKDGEASVAFDGNEWSSATPSGHEHVAPAWTPSRPPHAWLYAGVAAAVLGVSLALLRDEFAALMGWALGGLVTLMLWGVFIIRDGERLARGRAQTSGLTRPLQAAAVAMALVAVIANAWVFADLMARRPW